MSIINCAGCFKEIEFNDNDLTLVESLCQDCIDQICGDNEPPWVSKEIKDENSRD